MSGTEIHLIDTPLTSFDNQLGGEQMILDRKSSFGLVFLLRPNKIRLQQEERGLALDHLQQPLPIAYRGGGFARADGSRARR
jgi:hypothetical protein